MLTMESTAQRQHQKLPLISWKFKLRHKHTLNSLIKRKRKEHVWRKKIKWKKMQWSGSIFSRNEVSMSKKRTRIYHAQTFLNFLFCSSERFNSLSFAMASATNGSPELSSISSISSTWDSIAYKITDTF